MLKRLFTVRNLLIFLAIVALFVISGLLGLKVPAPVVSIAAEPIFDIGEFKVTNSLFTSWLAMLILVVVSYVATRRMPANLTAAPTQDLVPSGLQNFMEWIIESLHGMAKGIAGVWTPKFFPIVATIFLFVITSNWLGLIPGSGTIGWLEHPHGEEMAGFVAHGAILTGNPAAHGEEGYIIVPFLRAPSADLNFTVALALISVVLTQYFGVRAQKLAYFKKFFDISGFKNGVGMGIIGIFVGILELVSEIGKIISFSFRLFGNIFAGELLLMVMAFLIPYLASLPFLGLEMFVGFIQALVFMMLTLVFFTLATAGHHGSEEHH